MDAGGEAVDNIYVLTMFMELTGLSALYKYDHSHRNLSELYLIPGMLKEKLYKQQKIWFP